MNKTKKIYCYVDETGQDTNGKLFVVSVIVSEKDRDLFLHEIETLEKASGKGRLKWGRTKKELKLLYLSQIFLKFKDLSALRYSVFNNTKDFDLATIVAITKAIKFKNKHKNYKSLVYIDALTKSKRPAYARELRKLGVFTQKIKEVRKDENNPAIRLADSIAGWVRDVFEGNDLELIKAYKKAIKNKILVEV